MFKMVLELTVKLKSGEARSLELFMNYEDVERWLCYSPYLGMDYHGDTADSLVLGVGDRTIRDLMVRKVVVARLNGIASKSITVHVGDEGTGKIFRSSIPLADRNIKWEITDLS